MAIASMPPPTSERSPDTLAPVPRRADSTTASAPGDDRLTVDSRSMGSPGPPWLHTNLRSVIALALTGLVCYLALTGNSNAMAALTAAFSVLMGAIWGERAALKKPGQDS